MGTGSEKGKEHVKADGDENTHTHTHTPREDQCEWHRMTRMTGPDCVVMCNLINTHTHTHTHTHTPLSRLIGGFRNKYH